MMNNQITELHESFANLRELRILLLNFNNIKSLPKFVGNFEYLQELDISNNQLE